MNTYFDVTDRGNFEGRNILHTPKSLAEVAGELDMKPSILRSELDGARKQLYRAREQRPHPHRDEKILAAWNGMMISAFAKGALALGEPRFAKAAERAGEVVWTKLRTDAGRLRRSFKDGQASHYGYLVDYAAAIGAFLDLYEATSEPRWIERALSLQRALDAHHRDEEHGGYYRTADDHEELLTREKPSDDGSVPSGNSLAALNLLRLAAFTGEAEWSDRAERLFAAFGRPLRRRPTGMAQMLVALDFELDIPIEVVLVEPGDGVEPPYGLLTTFRATFVPNRIVSVFAESQRAAHQKHIPLLRGKTALEGKPTAYVCERGRCELPTSDAEVFSRQLRKLRQPLLENGAAPELEVAQP